MEAVISIVLVLVIGLFSGCAVWLNLFDKEQKDLAPPCEKKILMTILQRKITFLLTQISKRNSVKFRC